MFDVRCNWKFSTLIRHLSMSARSPVRCNVVTMCRRLFFCYSFRVIHDFCGIFQPILMTLFTWSLLAISYALLMIKVELVEYSLASQNERFIRYSLFFFALNLWYQTQHGNMMVLLLPVINGMIGLILVFIACELGQRINCAFDDINHTIEQSEWYLFPGEIKRMFPVIIANAQEPVSLECFGSIACTREVFKNVGINRSNNQWN